MKAVVLSSGGLDSTTCLGIAIDKLGKENVSTLSISYGQKHFKELECARKIADYYGVKHYEMDLSEIMKYSNCSLLQHSTEEIEHKAYSEQLKETNGNPVATYVPFRNGLFLSTVAALALSIYPEDEIEVYCGMHADDAAGNAYPDTSVQFNKAINEAIYLGSGNKVKVVSPLVELTKAEVVKVGTKLKVPYELTWSCYEGHDKACGKCGTCIDRLKAFELNGLKDPIEYEDSFTIKDYQEFAGMGILPAADGKNPLCHFAMGLCGESGEVCDAIKKRVFHGRDIPDEHIKEELGDVLWYVANLCNQLGCSIDELMKANMLKLKNRYPEMYGGTKDVKK